MYILLKPLFSRHKGIGVQFTDEPTGNVDPQNRDKIIKIFQSFQENGKTIVMVTHDEVVAKCAEKKLEL